MCTKNLKPIRTKSAGEMYANTDGIKNANASKHIKPEVKYLGSAVYVPELKMRITLKPGHTIQQWIIKHVLANPLKKVLLYDKYNISYEDELAFKAERGLK